LVNAINAATSGAMQRLILCLFLLLGLMSPAGANPVQRPNTTVELVSESASLKPGSTATLALVVTPRAGWHTYWQNFGDAGMETILTWTLPAGFSASPLRYPVPERIPFGSDLANYGYKSTNVLLLDLTVPADASGTVPLKVKAEWLVCDDQQCVPEDAELALSLPVGDGAADSARAGLFRDARAALPRTMPWAGQFAVQDKRFRITVPGVPQPPAGTTAEYFPLDGMVMSHSAAQTVAITADGIAFETAAGTGPFPEQLGGLLKLTVPGAPAPEGFLFTAAKTASLPAVEATATTSTTPAGLPSPLLALGLALLGGLILNLFPCVFPVLSLKALSLARAGETQSHARRDALAYTAGVLVTFAALGGLLLALRAGGQAIGWGFQLQDPRIIAGLALLMVAIALNLAGVFEVSTRLAGAGQGLTEKSGGTGAFFTGALAVLVATPCTAPFMGSALGAAVFFPPALAIGVFLALGIGLALPFLLTGFVPAFRRLLPRPGAWMATFKTALAFPMLATALWLLWVLQAQAGGDAMTAVLGLALALAFGLWLVGQAQAGRKAWPGAVGALAIVASLVLIPWATRDTGAATAQTAALPNGLATESFSPARLAELTAAGTPTFVYFTADWCITCKANERAALYTETVAAAFKAKGVTVLRADWTKRDDTIARALEGHGRTSIPLYLWYPAGNGAKPPVILPQILTPDLVVSTIA
jgi:thiol:disulfide interchange protein/DsbC/DsbD-like thiol-disulfide interchange protein